MYIPIVTLFHKGSTSPRMNLDEAFPIIYYHTTGYSTISYKGWSPSGWHLVHFKININFILMKVVLSLKLKFCWCEIASLWFLITFKGKGEIIHFKYWFFQSHRISEPLSRKKKFQPLFQILISSSIWENISFLKIFSGMNSRSFPQPSYIKVFYVM